MVKQSTKRGGGASARKPADAASDVQKIEIVNPGSQPVRPADEPTLAQSMRLGPDGESPIDIAGKNIPGDPALNNAGGLAEREMESTAERDDRAAAQSTRTAAALADKLDQGGDEDPFELLDRFSSITSGPRYARNQTFAQIRLLWGSAAAGARSFQQRIDKRIERAAQRG